jgi:hypothetical protein
MRRLAEELYPRADSVSTLLSHLEPLRVLAERRLPADSSLPGHIFKPTKPGGGGWGNWLMSTPISAIRVSAVLRLTPGMVSRSSTFSEKGAHSPARSRR